MSFARNYERKIDKMAENAIFSVYAVPIFVYQKQTYDDKYVDFSQTTGPRDSPHRRGSVSGTGPVAP